jgi:DNA-binding response OmpR family regulator
VIEDDGVIRDALREILEMSGYAVDTAIHGADALEKVRTGEILPSLILLDLNMPVMPGKEFLEKLRVESEAHARIPVVLMSAVPDENITGVAGILRKPVGMKAILERVRSFQGPA